MFSSTVIPTINRPTLSRAVQSMLDQNFDADDFEIIVVNDSGKPLSDAAWTKSRHARVINTKCRERSVARNAGAAIALGKYLHFLDDDDILLPGSLNAFWELAQKEPDADWLYGSWRSVDNDGNKIDEFWPELNGNIFALLVCGESLPLQASLLKADSFFHVGAFDPNPVLTGVEDRDVCRRLALYGNVAHTSALVAHIRSGEIGSSTNWKKIVQGDRWGREKVLGDMGAFKRLQTHTGTSFWRGRISRAYFASTMWNLQRGNFLVATSRFIMGAAITAFHPIFPTYWQGLRTRVK
jgi:glycosyltransferase involved in cell wall biosynthesis